jgi:hypothetical protein
VTGIDWNGDLQPTNADAGPQDATFDGTARNGSTQALLLRGSDDWLWRLAGDGGDRLGSIPRTRSVIRHIC